MREDVAETIRQTFLGFLLKAFNWLNPSDNLIVHPYIRLICDELEKIADQKTKRLIINLPPRHLKTFAASICLSAWILAHYPWAKILVLSYSQESADKIAYSIREIMRSPWYQRLFRTRLKKDRNRVHDYITTQGGGVRSISIEGGVTGVGANFILIDDPLQIKDARNEKQIEYVNDLFDEEIRTRLNNPKKDVIVITAHRLHAADLSGHVFRQNTDKSLKWKRLILPLVAPRRREYKLKRGIWVRNKGDLLRPDAFTSGIISGLRSSRNPGFETLQQQKPEVQVLLPISKEDFRTYDLNSLSLTQLGIVLSIDPGGKPGTKNSYSVVQAWAIHGSRYFLLDQARDRFNFSELYNATRHFIRRYRPSRVLIEATGLGMSLLTEIRQLAGMQVVPITPSENKATRLRLASRAVRDGCCFVPENAPWVNELLDEVTRFPRSEFDDQVDALSQFLNWLSQNPAPGPRPAMSLGLTCDSNGRVRSGHRSPDLQCRGGVLLFGRKRW